MVVDRTTFGFHVWEFNFVVNSEVLVRHNRGLCHFYHEKGLDIGRSREIGDSVYYPLRYGPFCLRSHRRTSGTEVVPSLTLVLWVVISSLGEQASIGKGRDGGVWENKLL